MVSSCSSLGVLALFSSRGHSLLVEGFWEEVPIILTPSNVAWCVGKGVPGPLDLESCLRT